MNNEKRKYNLHLLYLLIAPLVLFLPSLIKKEALFWGTASLQFIPWRALAWKIFLEEGLPLWNSLNGLGAPLLANYQLAFFYPPNWLQLPFFILGGVPALAASHTILVIFHLAFTGIGMALFLKSLRIGDAGQIVGGLAFSLSGYLIARVSFFSIIWTVAWLPWIFLFITKLLDSQTHTLKNQLDRKNLILLTICIWMMLLAGHAQTAWYTLLLASLWVLIRLNQQRDEKLALFTIKCFALAIFLGFCLAAVQLIPTYEYLTQSQRASSVDRDFALTYSFWPWRFLTFFMPDLFGTPINGTAWGYGNYWEDAVYMGAWPILLCLWTVVNFFKNRDEYKEQIMGSVVVIISGTILALGANTFVFPFLFDYIPTFNLFQAPARFMLWTVFGCAILAGIGTEILQSKSHFRIKKFMFVIVGFLGLGLAGLLSKDLLGNVPATFRHSVIFFSCIGLIGSSFIVLWKLSRRQSIQNIGKHSFIIFIILDFLFIFHKYNYTTSNALYKYNIDGEYPVSSGRTYLSISDDYDLKYHRFFRIHDFRPVESWMSIRSIDLPNINILNSRSIVNNFDPMVPARFAFLMEQLDTIPSNILMSWLKLMDVKTEYQIDVDKTDGVIRNPREGLGRFYWYDCAERSITFEDSWNKIIGNINNSIETKIAVIESKTPIESSNCKVENQAKIQIQFLGSNSQTFLVDTQAPGWLVISDTWYPGWRATIDGQQTQIYIANFIFRGIMIPEGIHTIKMWYAPESIYLGFGVTLVGLICLILLALKFFEHKGNESQHEI